MYIAKAWKDFEVLDMGDGEKLERWGAYLLRRPDPQVIWPARHPQMWSEAHATYRRSKTGGGAWELHRKLPEQWQVRYEPLDLTFQIKPMGFKHTGLFPEQAANWDWMAGLLRARPGARVLNLFAYTGGATAACAAAGAQVCHVDAAKNMVAQAKENLAVSGLGDKPVRYIVDDCVKFVQREIRRGRQYEGILMDPPSYGRGPSGEMWKIETALHPLVELCCQLLSDQPLFMLINSYTTGLQPAVLQNLLQMTAARAKGGHVQADEVGLPVKDSALVLPCGASGRWEA